MPTYPWRFQADLKLDDPDPDVTVFVGDTITNEVTGETTIHQNVLDPEIVKLSELSEYVVTAMASGITRTEKQALEEDTQALEEDTPPTKEAKPAPKRGSRR